MILYFIECKMSH